MYKLKLTQGDHTWERKPLANSVKNASSIRCTACGMQATEKDDSIRIKAYYRNKDVFTCKKRLPINAVI